MTDKIKEHESGDPHWPFIKALFDMLPAKERDPLCEDARYEEVRNLLKLAISSNQIACPSGGEAETYAAWQQKRGILADTIDWAILEYDEWMKDDHYDAQRVLDRIIAKLRERREPSLSELSPRDPAVGATAPIDMILHCPRCQLRHIDEPDERTPGWTNPPHRSHLCHGCGCIWRPADVATNGVSKIETTGKADTSFAAPPDPAVGAADDEREAFVKLCEELGITAGPLAYLDARAALARAGGSEVRRGLLDASLALIDAMLTYYDQHSGIPSAYAKEVGELHAAAIRALSGQEGDGL